jgi:hypothetical protein
LNPVIFPQGYFIRHQPSLSATASEGANMVGGGLCSLCPLTARKYPLLISVFGAYNRITAYRVFDISGLSALSRPLDRDGVMLFSCRNRGYRAGIAFSRNAAAIEVFVQQLHLRPDWTRANREDKGTP